MTTLKQLRQEVGLTAFDLAHLADVSLSTINRIERGRPPTTRLTAGKVITALGQYMHRPLAIDDVEGLVLMDGDTDGEEPQGLSVRDRAFLTDFTQFTHKNHIATAYMLGQWLNSVDLLEDVGIYTESRLRHYDSREAALADVRKFNDAKRIERIICAKILAEFAIACEDLGALGEAVRHRENGGIFQRYLKALPSHAGDFFDKYVLVHNVPDDPTITIETLLRLPALVSLAGRVTEEEYTFLQQSYRNCAFNLYGAARAYRDTGQGIRVMSNGDPLSSASSDEVQIILDLMPAGSVSKQKGGILARALNKIKHRFTLTERLHEYTDPQSTDQVEYAAFRSEIIDQAIESVVGAAGSMAEIAAIVLHLDEIGVL